MKQCPKCQTRLDDHAKVCLHCHYDFETGTYKKTPYIKEFIKKIPVIFLIIFAISFFFKEAIREHERVENIQTVIPTYSETAGTYNEVANNHPNALDSLEPFYNEFIDYVDDFEHKGEDVNTYTFSGNSLCAAYLDADITYKENVYTAYFVYHSKDSTFKSLIVNIPYIKTKGIDRDLLSGYCKLTGLNEANLFNEVTTCVNEIGKQVSYSKDVILKNKKVNLRYIDFTLQITCSLD